jgi:hypothetical protein
VLWAILGIVPAVLFVTGLLTWWRPSRRKAPLEAQEDLAQLVSGVPMSGRVSEGVSVP